MTLADINDTPYNIMLFLHILAMFVAFAPMFVHPFLENQMADAGPARTTLFNGIAKRSMRIYGSALVLGGVFGFGVAGFSKSPGTDDLVYEVKDGWLLTSVVLWLIMNGVLHALVIPGERAIGEGDESKTERVRLGSMALTGLYLVTLYLMVFKPGV